MLSHIFFLFCGNKKKVIGSRVEEKLIKKAKRILRTKTDTELIRESIRFTIRYGSHVNKLESDTTNKLVTENEELRSRIFKWKSEYDRLISINRAFTKEKRLLTAQKQSICKQLDRLQGQVNKYEETTVDIHKYIVRLEKENHGLRNQMESQFAIVVDPETNILFDISKVDYSLWKNNQERFVRKYGLEEQHFKIIVCKVNERQLNRRREKL